MSATVPGPQQPTSTPSAYHTGKVDATCLQLLLPQQASLLHN